MSVARFAFQACSFNHSDISPYISNQQFTSLTAIWAGFAAEVRCDTTVRVWSSSIERGGIQGSRQPLIFTSRAWASRWRRLRRPVAGPQESFLPRALPVQFGRDAKPTMTSAPITARVAPMRSVTVGRWPSAAHSHTSDAAM